MEISFNLHCVKNNSQVKFKIPNKRTRGGKFGMEKSQNFTILGAVLRTGGWNSRNIKSNSSIINI